MQQTVLVVDDEPIVRDVVVRYLERDGFRTLTASDGDTARDLIEQREPNLVVLDVMLPGTDGLSLCRWIRGRSSLPVILLTARGEGDADSDQGKTRQLKPDRRRPPQQVGEEEPRDEAAGRDDEGELNHGSRR